MLTQKFTQVKSTRFDLQKQLNPGTKKNKPINKLAKVQVKKMLFDSF